MMWNDYPGTGFMHGTDGGIVGLVLLVVLVATAVSLVVTRIVARRGHVRDTAPPAAGPRELLDRRFAAGEIDEDEYWRRSAVLDQRREVGSGG